MNRKELRVEKFLNEMDKVVPWSDLTQALSNYYKSTNGRRPHDL